MREIVVLSGKGGTGKTSLVASFAALAENPVLADCDIDAADLHLVLNPDTTRVTEFWSGQVAQIDIEKCVRCGLCETRCRFDAIHDCVVDPVACEGCGFCVQLCPTEAISMKEQLAGHLYVSQTRFGPLVHARLGVAQENSGKLVSSVRQQAKELATQQNLKLIVIDGPPGIGCPVISSLSGVELALLVTEPTLSGLHDLKRVMDTCRHFEVPPLVCINKYDINLENTEAIEQHCYEEEVPVAGRIPFDNVVSEAMVHHMPIVEYSQGEVAREITKLWGSVYARLT